MHCIIVTPERVVYRQPAEFVALALSDGEIGIAPRHAPLVGRLGDGELRVRRGETTDRFYIEGGFVEVLGDSTTVLTQRAVPAEKLDAEVRAAQLQAARSRRAASPEALAARQRAATRLRAQLRIARK